MPLSWERRGTAAVLRLRQLLSPPRLICGPCSRSNCPLDTRRAGNTQIALPLPQLPFNTTSLFQTQEQENDLYLSSPNQNMCECTPNPGYERDVKCQLFSLCSTGTHQPWASLMEVEWVRLPCTMGTGLQYNGHVAHDLPTFADSKSICICLTTSFSHNLKPWVRISVNNLANFCLSQHTESRNPY